MLNWNIHHVFINATGEHVGAPQDGNSRAYQVTDTTLSIFTAADQVFATFTYTVAEL